MDPDRPVIALTEADVEGGRLRTELADALTAVAVATAASARHEAATATALAAQAEAALADVRAELARAKEATAAAESEAACLRRELASSGTSASPPASSPREANPPVGLNVEATVDRYRGSAASDAMSALSLDVAPCPALPANVWMGCLNAAGTSRCAISTGGGVY